MVHDKIALLKNARTYILGNAELLRACGMDGISELGMRHVGEGEHNVNFIFWADCDGARDAASAQKFVLRINVLPQPFHKNQVAYEAGALKALEPCGRAPRLIYLDDSPASPGYGAMVISFCPGRQFDFDSAGVAELSLVANILADVHSVAPPSPQIARLYWPADALSDMFNENIARYKAYLASGHTDGRVTAWVERFIAAARPALECAADATDCSHIINTEPLASHFLIGEGGGYFVDWERPLVGEVAQDVAYFVSPTSSFWDSDYFFTNDDAQEFIEIYWRAVDGRFERGNFDARVQAYRKVTALRSVTWCAKALARYSDPTAHRTEKTMSKLPVYLSDEFFERLFAEVF